MRYGPNQSAVQQPGCVLIGQCQVSAIATIESGNYTGGDLAIEIQTELNSQTQTATSVNNMFICAYVVKTNKITITCNNLYAFRIITQPELKTIDWSGSSFDRNKPNDFNEVLSNLDNYSKRYNSVIPYVSGSLNLQPFNSIYIFMLQT